MSGIEPRLDSDGHRTITSAFGPFENGPLTLAQRLPNIIGRKRQDYVRETYVLASNISMSFFMPSGQVSVNTQRRSCFVLFMIHAVTILQKHCGLIDYHIAAYCCCL
jgi:hypothetical protein